MDDCIFCQILAGSIPAHFVYQDDRVVAFLSLEQPNPYKVLVIPRALFRHERCPFRPVFAAENPVASPSAVSARQES